MYKDGRTSSHFGYRLKRGNDEDCGDVMTSIYERPNLEKGDTDANDGDSDDDTDEGDDDTDDDTDDSNSDNSDSDENQRQIRR
jgi:Ran GTPase-activating protein (RanGAP) involved in mRNA processing and transport